MATSGSGSAASAAASGTFAVSGYTIAELELLVEQATGLDMDVAAELKRIDQAITAAGHAAATWNGHGWWWTQATLATFDTAANTSIYNLRTVNSNAMQDIHAIQQIILDDDFALGKFHDKIEYDNYVTMFTSTNKPARYAVWGDLSIGLAPIPGDTYTMTVSYLKHHSEITGAGSSDAALIVPADFQWGVYVAAATWLLRRDTLKPASLKECPAFVEAMGRMAAADPSADYDQNMQGVGYPAGDHVTRFPTDSPAADYGF